ncbi:MAG: cytochrome c-type biogenesis protein [Pseudomonadota bacterium]
MKKMQGTNKKLASRLCIMMALCFAVVAVPILPAGAVDPEIMLADPELEARAQALTRQLRCPTCVSQSVDSSNVGVSRDLQILVRDRISAGHTDQEILDYIASRYGDFVLLRPRAGGFNTILWLAPAILFVFVIGALALAARRKTSPETQPLTAAEKQALARLNNHEG